MDVQAARGSQKVFRCEKSHREVPLADPRCMNPKAYCRWRTACPVHMLEKEQVRKAR